LQDLIPFCYSKDRVSGSKFIDFINVPFSFFRKFKSLNGEIFSDERIEEIANTVRNLDELNNIAGLVGLCRRPDRLTA
jgi:hypothetical protein